MGKRFKERFKKLCCWKKTSSDSSDSEGEDTVQPINASQNVQQQPANIKVHAKSQGEDATRSSVHASQHVQQQESATNVRVNAKSAKKKGKSRKPSKEESFMIKQLDEQSEYLSQAITNVQSKIKDLERLNEETRQRYQALIDITSELEKNHEDKATVANQVELTTAQEGDTFESMDGVPKLDILAEHRLLSGLGMNSGPLVRPKYASEFAGLYADTSERFTVEPRSVLVQASRIYDPIHDGNIVLLEYNPPIHTNNGFLYGWYRDNQAGLNLNIPINTGHTLGNIVNPVVKPCFESPFVQPLNYVPSQIGGMYSSIACGQTSSGVNVVTEAGVQLPVVPYSNAACYDPFVLSSSYGEPVLLGMDSCWVQLNYNNGIDVSVALELMVEIELDTAIHGTSNTRIILNTTLDQIIKVYNVVYKGFKQSKTKALMSSSDSVKGESFMPSPEGLHYLLVLLKIILQLPKIMDVLRKNQQVVETKQQQISLFLPFDVIVDMGSCVARRKQTSDVTFLADNTERNTYRQQMDSSILERLLYQVKEEQMKMRCIQAMLAHHFVAKGRSEILAIPQAIPASVNWKIGLEPRRQFVTIPSSVPRSLLQSYQSINKQKASGLIRSNLKAVAFTKADVEDTTLIVLVSMLHWEKYLERPNMSSEDASMWSLKKICEHQGGIYALKENSWKLFEVMLAHRMVAKGRSEMLAMPQAILASVTWRSRLEPRRQFQAIEPRVPRFLLQSYHKVNKDNECGSVRSNLKAVALKNADAVGTTLIVLVSMLHWKNYLERPKMYLGDSSRWSLKKICEHQGEIYALKENSCKLFEVILVHRMMANRRNEMLAIPQAILASVPWTPGLEPRRQFLAKMSTVPRFIHQSYQSINKPKESRSVRSNLKAVAFTKADVVGTTLINLVSLLHWAKYVETQNMSLEDANMWSLKKICEHQGGIYALKGNSFKLFVTTLVRFMVAKRRRSEMLAIPQAILASVTWRPGLEPRRQFLAIQPRVPRIIHQIYQSVNKPKELGRVRSKLKAVAFTKADVVGTTLIVMVSMLHWQKYLETPKMSLGDVNILSIKSLCEVVVRIEEVLKERNDREVNLEEYLNDQGMATYKEMPHLPNGLTRSTTERYITIIQGHFGCHDQEPTRRQSGDIEYGRHRSQDDQFKASPILVPNEYLKPKRSPRMNDESRRCGSTSSEEVHRMDSTVRGGRSPRTSTGSPRVEDFSRIDDSPRADGPSLVKVKGESWMDIKKLVAFESAVPTLTPEVIKDPIKEYRISLNKRPMISLRDLITKGVRFDESHAQFLSINLLLTLKFLTIRRIIHADINPGKVVFNDKGYPCLIGFEKSEIIGRSLQRDQTYTIPKIEYCSPEQFTKQGHVTEATDVFSTGVLLFTMMFGRSPHKDINYQKTKVNLLKESFVPRFKPDGILSWRGKLFVALCIRKDPTKRFSLSKCQSCLVDSVKWFKGYDETSLANQRYPSPFIKLISEVQKKRSANQTSRSIPVPKDNGLIPGQANKVVNSGSTVIKAKGRNAGQISKSSDPDSTVDRDTGLNQDSNTNQPDIPHHTVSRQRESRLPKPKVRKPGQENTRVSVPKDTMWNRDSNKNQSHIPLAVPQPNARISELPRAKARILPGQRNTRRQITRFATHENTSQNQDSDTTKSHLPVAVHRYSGSVSEGQNTAFNPNLTQFQVIERNTALKMDESNRPNVVSQITKKNPVKSHAGMHAPLNTPRVKARGLSQSQSQSAIPVATRHKVADKGTRRDIKKSCDI